MKDYELNVLDQYQIEVTGTHRTRGAILCDTNLGLLLLKESKLSNKRVPMLCRLHNHLEVCGYNMTDRPIENSEGEIISVREDGSKYMLKQWFDGRECDVRKESEIIAAVKNLARLHEALVLSEEINDFTGADLAEECLRHNRELKKTRTFIRNKTPKGDFELVFLEHFDYMYDWAQRVVDYLEESEYQDLLEESIRQGKFVHGEYNYHNVLFIGQETATTNFEHFYVDIQAADLYYFLRKVMEKYHWNEKLGSKILNEYCKIRPMEKEERKYLAVRLAYPEKFWKSANTYYNSNKAWIPAKNIEKLLISIEQIEEKRKFLENIFAFHL
ncbi:MAG: CotS family spore coat protein [Lachnospiraceae bacterium]